MTTKEQYISITLDEVRERSTLTPPNERQLWKMLNPDQKRGLRNSQQTQNVQHADTPTKNQHGCVEANLLIPNGTPAHRLAIEAMTGDQNPNLLITKDGKVALFDAKFYDGRDINKIPQRFKSARGTLWEVESIIPRNEKEMAAAQKHLANKVAQWNYQGAVANECGYKMIVGIADQALFNWASRNLKVNPGITIVQRSLAGSYTEVRNETVGGQVHHIPAAQSLKNANTMRTTGPVTYTSAPTLWMRTSDHRQTASHGNTPGFKNYQLDQANLIREGQSRKAYEMDLRDITTKFPDGRYNRSLIQLEQFIQRDRTFDRINQDTRDRQQSQSLSSPEQFQTPFASEQAASQSQTRTISLTQNSLQNFKTEPEVSSYLTMALAYEKLIDKKDNSNSFRDRTYTATVDSVNRTTTVSDQNRGKLFTLDWDNQNLEINRPATAVDLERANFLKASHNQRQVVGETPNYYEFPPTNLPQSVQSIIDGARILAQAHNQSPWLSRYQPGEVNIKTDGYRVSYNLTTDRLTINTDDRGEILSTTETGTIAINNLKQEDSTAFDQYHQSYEQNIEQLSQLPQSPEPALSMVLE